MKHIKRFLSGLLVLCLVASLLPVQVFAAEIVDSGSCGDNVIWTLSDDGLLTISGSGSMSDNYTKPWHSARNSIKHVIIEDGITSIGDYAFQDCGSMSSVSIPDSVVSIGKYAFYCCKSLTDVTIPEYVTTIGQSAFYHCDSLGNVTVPNNVTSIGDYAFQKCTSLTSVTIGNSVTSIGKRVFYNCTSLQGIYVDSNNPFYSCDSYGVLFDKNKTRLIQAPAAYQGYYSIPDGVIYIGECAFESCYSLTVVTIPDSVTSIGFSAFEECTSLMSVNFPDSVTSIGESAFWDCDSLTSVTIPDSVTYIDMGAFYDCDSLTNVTIGNGVTSIGMSAFEECNSLNDVTIGNSVTNINGYAFYNCDSLTSVTIPDSVAFIGGLAFAQCRNLNKVIFCGNAPEFCESEFDDSPNSFRGVTATAYYPANNPTWTSDVMQDYSGTITWVPYNPGETPGGGSGSGGTTEPEEDKMVFEEVKKNTFFGQYEIMDSAVTGMGSSKFTYEDSYFANSAMTYNHNLATLSLGIQCCCEEARSRICQCEVEEATASI